MSAGTNKTLVRGYYQRVVADGVFGDIAKYVADSYIDHNAPPGSGTGPTLVEAHLRAIRHTFPDFTLRMHDVIA